MELVIINQRMEDIGIGRARPHKDTSLAHALLAQCPSPRATGTTKSTQRRRPGRREERCLSSSSAARFYPLLPRTTSTLGFQAYCVSSHAVAESAGKRTMHTTKTHCSRTRIDADNIRHHQKVRAPFSSMPNMSFLGCSSLLSTALNL